MQFFFLKIKKIHKEKVLIGAKTRKNVKQLCSKLIEFCFLLKILYLISAKIPQEMSLRDEVNQELLNFTTKIDKHRMCIIQSYI